MVERKSNQIIITKLSKKNIFKAAFTILFLVVTASIWPTEKTFAQPCAPNYCENVCDYGCNPYTCTCANAPSGEAPWSWNRALIQIPDPSGGVSNPATFVYRMETTIFGMAGAITFIAIIVSGIKYMAARSDPKATIQAKKALTYSIVGLFLVISSYTIRIILFNLGS